MLATASILVFGALLVVSLRRLRLEPFLIAIVLAGAALCVGYLSYTQIGDRNYDGSEHLRYVQFVADHARLPPMSSCVACGHPPLYYVLGAIFITVLRPFSLAPPATELQALSLLFSLGFVVFSVLTMRRFLPRPSGLRLATALLVFWPTTIINSVRLHNDSLAAMCMAGALFFTVRYAEEERPKHLTWAAVWAGLALLTKSSGYTVAAVLLAVLVAKAWRGSSGRTWKPAVVALAIILASMALAARGRASATPPTICERVLGRACNISSEHFVGNRLANYLYFDTKYFLTEPFVANDPSAPAKDYFWNAVAKSSLFGTMPLGIAFASRTDAALGILLSALLLALAVFAVVSALDVTTDQVRRHRVLLLTGASMLALLAVFRVLVPTRMHEDFRHIFPAVILISILVAKAVERHRARQKALFWFGVGLILAFTLASMVLFRPRG